MKKFQIGQMRERVRFEFNTPEEDGFGGQIDRYEELVTTRGYLQDKSGNRTIEDGQVLLVSYCTLYCRIQQAIESQLNQGLRVLIGNRIFTITKYTKIDQRQFIYQFNLNESEQGN